jgi:hypothetical protein
MRAVVLMEHGGVSGLATTSPRGLPRATTRHPVSPARPVIIERVSGQPLGTFLREGASGSALLMRVLDWPVTGIE